METDKPRNKGGRPPGATNRLTQEAVAKARETGLLPHEILLDMARGNPQQEITIDPMTGKHVVSYVALDVDQRRDAAKAAAPYYAPKISTVEVIRNVDDAELDFIIAELAAQTGLVAGAGGEAEEDDAQDAAGGGSTPRTRVRRKLVED